MLTSFLGHGWASSPERLAVAAAVTLGFGVLACALRGVNRSGALAGGLACFLLFANAGPTAFATLAVLFLMTWVATRLAMVAALAEAATDTVASEIGQYRRPDARLITTWERVPTGTDGGITIPGSIAGLAAGLVVAAVATAGGMLPQAQLWIPVTAGFAGMLIDSILGATLQRRGWISNQVVNFFATMAAGALAYGIVMVA